MRAGIVLTVCRLTYTVSSWACRLLPQEHPVRVLSEAGERQIAELREEALIRHLLYEDSVWTHWWRKKELAMGVTGAVILFFPGF